VYVALFYYTDIGELLRLQVFFTSEPGGTHPRLRIANIHPHPVLPSVCLRARRYLHYAPTRPHIGLSPAQHPCTPQHFTPTPLPTTPVRCLTAFAVLDINIPVSVSRAQLGFVPTTAKDSTILTMHTNHSINTRKHPTPTPLGKVYQR